MKTPEDLMIRGGDFYAIWVEDRGLWSTDEQDVIRLVDRELDNYYQENKHKFEGSTVKIQYMWDADSGMIDKWHRYCQKQMRNSYVMLDEKLIFSNSETNKKDYSSKRLSYPLEPGDIPAWSKLISTLYSPEEREKIEWAIGAIVTGHAKEIQKFMVLYGSAGTGKSTILNVIQQLFEGYYAVFDAKALGSSSNQFALEAFRTNPLVAIQHDGDLSRIEDNTRLNSLVSHEKMIVNEKYTKGYENSFKCFLFMGTNKPVKITDAKSGLIRRLIDVTPSGNKVEPKEYRKLVKQVSFELGGIACHCRDVYLNDPGKYDDYIPVAMMGASNDFYNFVIDAYHIFKEADGTTLKAAWEMYKTYCDEAKVSYPLPRRNFQEELKNYFHEYSDRFSLDDGSRVRSYYSGFKTEIFETQGKQKKKEKPKSNLISFDATESLFDKERADCLAQYASSEETPTKKWEKVVSKLSELDTSKLHYVRVPENHIVIDFDIPDDDGNKCLERNIEAASKWPPTYAELSKSGQGVHLHYIYTGDPAQLSRVYDDRIEVKVFTGKSSLRRKLTKCNDLPIATISSGLPLKREDKMMNFEGIKNEKMLRAMIKRNLNKEYHNATKPSIDYINALLEKAYAQGVGYDVSDMYNAVLAFAAGSTNQADYCIKLVNKMRFKSDEPSVVTVDEQRPLVFYDVEVFPNLFLVNWKFQGEGKPVVRMINPTSTEIEELMHLRLVGFNCRRYDNHILYARLMGYTNEQLYNLSQKIVSGDRNAFLGEAYNVSYTDVYDFSAKKQSLKKWEIELGIHHQELGLPWDQPVPEDRWLEVAEYCDNDVVATEKVFDHLKPDFLARQILADVAGLSVNDTTNSLTTRIIFGNNRKPQDQFNYRNMGEISLDDYILADHDEYSRFTKDNKPIFPGYIFEAGKSTYRGEDVGEGGYVYAEPGIYGNVALLDIASMHPASIIAEQLFGPEYTKRFQEIRDARVAIKHKDFDAARKMLDGKLAKYLDDEGAAADLAQALKIAINSVYGLTSAGFENPFRDNRNKDNIVAKRGALFMINLKYEVQKRGFTVAHVKTDSIKIPDATPEIIQFVMDYGKKYGYSFEHEATYDRMCLVNDAVYIAKYKDGKHAGEWTATGTQFQVPYVFKKLFSREPIEFADLCETKSVSSALYLNATDSDSPEFIGRVGSFCPIKPGCGGGELLRESRDKDGNVKYGAATGTKGYFWLESEAVKLLGKENDIDLSYYDKMVNDAVDAISKYGDFEWFVSDDPYVGKKIELDIPPWMMPCGDKKYDTCFDCPNFIDDKNGIGCGLGYDNSDLIMKRSEKYK
jgi:energy-coupling factor transporter ATP-binding protein EcfA2